MARQKKRLMVEVVLFPIGKTAFVVGEVYVADVSFVPKYELPIEGVCGKEGDFPIVLEKVEREQGCGDSSAWRIFVNSDSDNDIHVIVEERMG